MSGKGYRHQRSLPLSRLTRPPCQRLRVSSLWSAFFHNNSPYGSPPQDQECLLPRLSWFFAWFGWLSCYCYGCLQDNCNKPLNWFSLGVPAPGYWRSGTESARLRPILAKQERGQEAAKQHSYTRRMGHGGSQPCYSGTTGRFVNNRRKQPGSVIPISKR